MSIIESKVKNWEMTIKTDLISFKIMKTTLEMVNKENTARINDAIQSLRDEFVRNFDKWANNEEINFKLNNKANQYYVENKFDKCISIARNENEGLNIKLEEYKGEVGRKMQEFSSKDEFEKFK